MLKNIIVNNIYQNKIIYIKICITFLLGVCLGVICVNNLSENSFEESKSYFNNFIENISNENDNIKKLFLNTFFTKSKIIGVLFILSFTVIGSFIIYLLNIYKGFSIGYAISILIKIYGMKRGILFVVSTLLFQNIIYIPCVIFFSVYSIISCQKLKNRSVDIKMQVIKNLLLFFVILIISAIATVVELTISYKIIKKIKVFY